jgi:photosystem II stability/assembly factor-like uncharacterized protein
LQSPKCIKLKLFFFLLFIACSNSLFGQWNHIPSGNNYSLSFVKIDEASGTCIAGGTNFLTSADAGLTWTTVNSPIYVNIYSVAAAVIVSNSTFVLADNSNGYYKMWRTTNGGSTWTGYTQSNGIIRDMASNGSVILAVGDAGLIKKSVDNGATWTTVSSPIYTNFKTVEWDAASNTWVLGGGIRRMISTNSNPTSFTYTTLPYTISDLNFNNGHLVETRTFTNNTQSVVLYDASGAVISETPSNSILIRDPFYVSTNKIVSNNYYNFYETHPDQTTMFQYVDTLISNSQLNGVQINSMDFCSTYGLAVGASGGIARYDMSATSDLLLPATFNFNTSNPCAGTSVMATPEYLGGESFQWYLDSVPVSANDTLIFNQPANGLTHSVTLELTYNGNTTTYTQSITSTPPPTFPTFGVNVDTTLCYLDQVKFYFTGVTATPAQNFKVRLLRNGLVVSDTMDFNYGINYIPGPFLSEDDTIQLQLFKTISCGTFFQTVDYHFHVGPNLTIFQLVSADSGICQANSQLHFSLANTIPGASYSFNYVLTGGGSPYNANFDTFTGIGSDTLDFNYNAANFYNTQDYNHPLIYEHPNYTQSISFNASLNGCSVSAIPVFNFDLLYTDAVFSIRNESYFPGDTVRFDNVLQCDNFSWNIFPSIPLMSNLSDSIPTLIPSASGLYTLQLAVESRYGCVDTITQRLIVADAIINNTDVACYAAKLPAMAIIGSKISSKGNFYDFGYFNYCCPYRTGFALRKLDQNGNLLWDKNNSQSYTGATMICAMDIDANENVYAVMYIRDTYFNYELIDYSNEINGSTYLVQWDSLGNMLKAKRIGSKSVFMDLVVHNDRILLGSYSGIASYDLNFNYMGVTPISGYNYFMSDTYGSNEDAINQWRWNPNKLKLEKLANGKVAVVARVNHVTMTFGSSITLSPALPCNSGYIPDCSKYTFVAIYDPNIGFTDAAKVFESELFTSAIDVSSDKESNIYLITNDYYNGYNGDYEIGKTTFFDSIIQLGTKMQVKKSFLAKINSYLEPVWIKETSAINGYISCAKESEELVLSGAVYSDFYIGAGNDFKRMSGKNEDSIDYNPISNINGDNFTTSLYEPFWVKLDLNGNPINGKMIGKAGFGDNLSMTSRTSNVVSPCGDIYLSHQDKMVDGFSTVPYTYNPNQNQLDFDGQSYLADSTLVFKFSSSTNCSDECTFFQFNGDDIQGSCSVDTVTIPVNFVYGIDSVEYDLLANGSIIESGYLQFNAYQLALPLPGASAQYSVVLHPTSQTSDTVLLNGFVQPIVPDLQSSYSVACGEELVLSVSNVVFNTSNWLHNQGVIDPAFTSTYTNSDFIIGDTTSYSVSTIDSNGCSASSSFNIIYCYDLGLNEQATSDFQLFPNPATDAITIVTSNVNWSELSINITDTRGNKIGTYKLDNVATRIPVQNLSSGLYFIQINSQSGVMNTIPFTKE